MAIRWLTVTAVVISLAAGGGGGFGVAKYLEGQRAAADARVARERAEQQRNIGEEAARPFFAETLRDPESLQLREVRINNLHVCGEFNARNGSGGYAGFRRFILSPNGTLFTFQEEGDRAVTSYEARRVLRQLLDLQERLWTEACETESTEVARHTAEPQPAETAPTASSE